MSVAAAIVSTVTSRLPRVRGAGRVAHIAQKMFAHLPEQATWVRGVQLRLRPAEYVDGWLMFGPQFYEHEELRYLERRLSPGDVFLDIGAHIGLWSLIASRIVGPSGRVLAYEADPETFQRLVDNIALNGATNVTPVHVGVSDRHEVLRFGVGLADNRAAGGFLLDAVEAVSVQCRPLATMLREAGVARIAFAKLDVEGFEHRVLAGLFTESPPSVWPRTLVVEVHPHLVGTAGGDARHLLRTYRYREVARHGINSVFERS